MDKPIFAVDLDGVIVALLEAAVRRCGIPLPISGYADVPTYVLRGWGLSRDQAVAVTRELYNPVTALEAEPYDGATDAWRILERLGEVHVITARADRYREATYQWLARHRLAPASVTFTQDKGQAARALGITLAFEDAPKHIAQYVAADIPVAFPLYPYNCNCPGIAYRSWKELFSQEPLAGLLDAAIAAEQAREVAA